MMLEICLLPAGHDDVPRAHAPEWLQVSTSAQPHCSREWSEMRIVDGRQCIENQVSLFVARIIRFCLLLAVINSSQLFPSTSHMRRVIDQDYIAALAAANRFLQAWQNQDHETAIILLSDKLKQHTSEEALETFFTPADHAQQAYEISSGNKIAPGRYIFTVKLLKAGSKAALHKHSRLIVTRTGKDDWAIDKLP